MKKLFLLSALFVYGFVFGQKNILNLNPTSDSISSNIPYGIIFEPVVYGKDCDFSASCTVSFLNKNKKSEDFWSSYETPSSSLEAADFFHFVDLKEAYALRDSLNTFKGFNNAPIKFKYEIKWTDLDFDAEQELNKKKEAIIKLQTEKEDSISKLIISNQYFKNKFIKESKIRSDSLKLILKEFSEVGVLEKKEKIINKYDQIINEVNKLYFNKINSMHINNLLEISLSTKKYSLIVKYHNNEVKSFIINDRRGKKKEHYFSEYNGEEKTYRVKYFNREGVEEYNFNETFTIKYYNKGSIIKETYLDSIGGLAHIYYNSGIKNASESNWYNNYYANAINKLKTFYKNGNLESSGLVTGDWNNWEDFVNPYLKNNLQKWLKNFKIRSITDTRMPLAFSNWAFYSNNGTYSAIAKLEGKKIKGNAEIYKSGEFVKEVNFNNKKSRKLLDYLNKL